MTSYAIISSTTAWFFLMWRKWVSTDVVQPKYAFSTFFSPRGHHYLKISVRDFFHRANDTLRRLFLILSRSRACLGLMASKVCQSETRLRIKRNWGGLNQQVFSVHFTWCVSPSTGGMTTVHCADWEHTLPPPSETNTLHYSQESLFGIKY